tara:strand:+ start:2808 stop:2996 length:189 start_codon:yes stop_codon:yes gene_type:complete
MPTSGGNNCNCDSQNGGGRKRKPTKYNLYMKSEIKKLKGANPKITHQEAFKKAANNWSANKK